MDAGGSAKMSGAQAVGCDPWQCWSLISEARGLTHLRCLGLLSGATATTEGKCPRKQVSKWPEGVSNVELVSAEGPVGLTISVTPQNGLKAESHINFLSYQRSWKEKGLVKQKKSRTEMNYPLVGK